MESMNHKESNTLRDVDLMTDYLHDRLSLSKVNEIESEMEQDPLYQLAMEALAQSMLEDPAGTPTKMKATEDAFPELLISAKHRFIEYLEKESEEEPDVELPEGNWWTNIPNWQKWVGGIGLLLLVSSIAILPLIIGNTGYHKDPVAHLIIDGDILLGEQYLGDCGEKNPGIGRGKEVTLYSAFVENYVQGNYAEAIRQFRQIEHRPGLSDQCGILTRFYLAKSFMMEGVHVQAESSFRQVLENSQDMPAITHAAHWYLGNLALSQDSPEKAAFHFEILSNSDPNSSDQHLEALMKKNYIQEAKLYLNELTN